MAAITPTSEIYFVSVPWKTDNTHVTDDATTITKLLANPIQVVTNYTYQRMDSVIRAGKHIDDLITANYVLYRNSAYSTRWFCAYITKMTYKNDGMTEVAIATDHWQTWRDKISLKSCFVEREHVADDTLGKNTIDEGLETGEHIAASEELAVFNSQIVIVVAVTAIPDPQYPPFTPGGTPPPISTAGYDFLPTGGNMYDGVYSGAKLYAFGLGDGEDLNAFLGTYTQYGGDQYVIAVYVANALFLGLIVSPDDKIDPANRVITPSTTPRGNYQSTLVNRTMNTIDGYTPKNNKMFCYPYNFEYVHNNNGSSLTLRYEDFAPFGKIERHLKGIMTAPNGVIKMQFTNQINEANKDLAITLNGFPLCSWQSNAYMSWLANNAGSIFAQSAGNVISLGSSALTGNPIGVLSGVAGIASQLASYRDQSRNHSKLEGTMSSPIVNTAFNEQTFFTQRRTVRAEYARIIDEFFSAYGYKVNRHKVPSLTSRPSFNFIKTQGCVVAGAIPEDAEKAIVSMFDAGVTIWHTYENIGNYAIANLAPIK